MWRCEDALADLVQPHHLTHPSPHLPHPTHPGLNANKLRDFQREALRSLQALAQEPGWADWLDQGGFLQEKGWPAFHEALRAAHCPSA